MHPSGSTSAPLTDELCPRSRATQFVGRIVRDPAHGTRRGVKRRDVRSIGIPNLSESDYASGLRALRITILSDHRPRGNCGEDSKRKIQSCAFGCGQTDRDVRGI
jgi:hypothetical protein